MSTFFVGVKDNQFVETKLSEVIQFITDHPDLYFDDKENGIVGIKPKFANEIRAQDPTYQKDLPVMKQIVEAANKAEDPETENNGFVISARAAVNEITENNRYTLEIYEESVVGLTRYGTNDQDVAAALLNTLINCERVICENDSEFHDIADNE